MNLLQALNFLLIYRNDEFARKPVGNVFFLAKLKEQIITFPAKRRPRPSGWIVNAGVNYSAVVPCLMGGDPVCFVNNQYVPIWPLLLYTECGSEAYCPGAGDEKVRSSDGIWFILLSSRSLCVGRSGLLLRGYRVLVENRRSSPPAEGVTSGWIRCGHS